MQITKEQIDQLNAIVKLKISPEDYQEKVDNALKKYSKQVQIKGFRKGFVPLGMVKKMYGNSILAEEVNRLLQDELFKYLDEQKIEVLGQPLPMDNQQVELDINKQQDYVFDYEIGIAPELKLDFFDKKPTYEQIMVDITDKMIDEEVENIRMRHGKQTFPDDIAENDVLYVTLTELNADGSEKENGVQNATSFNENSFKDNVKKEVFKMKKGDKIQINIWESFEREKNAVAKFMLNVEENRIDEISPLFNMEVTNISRLEPAELNEAFFLAQFGEGVDSEEAMRNHIKQNLETYFGANTERSMLNQVGRDLLEKSQIALPEAFLKKWIKATNEKPITEEQIDKEFPAFENQLKWDLIMNHVAREKELKVEADEIRNRARALVQNQLLQYGLGYLPDEQLDQFAKRYMDDKNFIRKTHEQILEEKVLSSFKDRIHVTEKKLSLEEYNKFVEEQNAQHHHHHHEHDHDHEHEHDHAH